MGGVPDAQQARPVPPGKPVDADGEQLHVLPAANLSHTVGGERRELRHSAPECLEAARVDRLDGSLRDDVAALPVLAAVDHDEDPADVEAPHGLCGIGGSPGEAEPQDVHRCAELQTMEEGLLPDHRGPAIGAHDQVRADRQWALRCGHANAHRAPRLLDQPGHLRAHPQIEGGVAARQRGEEVQEVPLRHERNELAAGRQVAKVRDGQRYVTDLRVDLVHLLVGELQEVLQHAQLVQELERRGVDRVASEVAEKVRVLFQDDDVDTRAGQQQPQHHPGRAATGDAAADRRHLPSHAGSPLSVSANDDTASAVDLQRSAPTPSTCPDSVMGGSVGTACAAPEGALPSRKTRAVARLRAWHRSCS